MPFFTMGNKIKEKEAIEKLRFPKDYKENKLHMGSWFMPSGEAVGFHNVYIDKNSFKTLKNTGAVPDGAKILKELVGNSEGDYTTGKGVSYTNGAINKYFLMVRNSKDKYSYFSPNRGSGWGWGWAEYMPNNLEINTSTNYRYDCIGCHIPATGNDYLYKEAYSVFK
ncbi:cytochrome P460 family protein [Vibrio sp. Sgm 5]|uniref:cytochrome P460 family protein n=1 Tax=Vibrio sp. Sgm 5 TaxID=2994387 RepID=UPI002248BA21|nr:cytochrome P460 family protein [Vibrio sp. Sgm 5]MCX2792537.1 cytochrome P460 family protein [Vibrio sp. Sgm 5]